MSKDPKASAKSSVAEAAHPTAESGRDWSATLFLPKTDFPMGPGCRRWSRNCSSAGTRSACTAPARAAEGPPEIHPPRRPALRQRQHPHRARAQQDPEGHGRRAASRCSGNDSNYVPGWDCHGLPIEWKIEEQYRAKGKNKELRSPRQRVPQASAASSPSTGSACSARSSSASASRATGRILLDHGLHGRGAPSPRELMKFAVERQLYAAPSRSCGRGREDGAGRGRGRIPGYSSDTVWVKFPIKKLGEFKVPTSINNFDQWYDALVNASVVIWTATPWTIPGNRAISFSSPKSSTGFTGSLPAPEGNWAKVGDCYLIAEKLSADVFKAAKVRSRRVPRRSLARYAFAVSYRPPARRSWVRFRRSVARWRSRH